MRILIVSDLYPPYYRGGYEVHCAQVAEALGRAGHDILVLTSVYGLPVSYFGGLRPRCDRLNGVRVFRWLNEYAYGSQPARRPWTLFQARRELRDAREFRSILNAFQPDLINWWNMEGLSKMLIPLAQACGIPDVLSIDDLWMIREYGLEGEIASRFWVNLWDGTWGPHIGRPLLRWGGRRWEKRVQREGLPTRNFPNRPRHVCFLSKYLRTLHREAGIEFDSAEVIYGGMPTAHFYQPVRRHHEPRQPLRVLYAGQVSPDRGLHTAVEAFGCLDSSVRSRLTLTVAGDGPSHYVERVKTRIEALGLRDCVSFLGKVPHEEMPHIYKQHDVLVFTSGRREGLGFTQVEAMLAGCAVVTTGSGGAAEIAAMADLPTFPPEDAARLSVHLGSLVADRAKVVQTACRGQEVALREFSFDRMMNGLNETFLRIHEEDKRSHPLAIGQ